ncbi:type I DNA topoisomerase [Canibacter sp. lx-72]|uniref:type I DNA topoisomerase n=1 Tax=Canibacter zhuwentaonis TaxID=2837491 RepID=UPI001BDDB365|nr:type I DNA topoisomerase [Canibacter zhuwentaonis]MBT1018525.1 type I DNA topoisomerase [Canibacter zhuwentaonis]
MAASKKLVIVESPTKARTISGFLGKEYEVVASVGHIRDLAEPSELPAELKHGELGKFAVDVGNDFAPYYVVSDNKKKTVAQLKRALKDADELWLATDEDREGEAIAWHLLEVLKPKVPVCRMVFHEITKQAIDEAVANTREIDTNLVDAQETRRILDRLYGYDISPVLWRKVGPKLSAGRVQSVATRLVVDRERERMDFISVDYCSVTAQFNSAESDFSARLNTVNGKKVATGADFNEHGELSAKNVGEIHILNAEAAQEIAATLAKQAQVVNRETKPYRRRPAAPFTTSTLQQEASRKLNLSSWQAMSVAQSLYEKGYITYMRTDSSNLSAQAVNAARTAAAQLYGGNSVAPQPRVYAQKNKSAQEAHEAIRPAGEVFAQPQSLKRQLTSSELALYDLIWKRTVASQMADATGSTDTITIADTASLSGTSAQLEFKVSGTVITFPGFLAAYEEGRDDKSRAEKMERLPLLEAGDAVQITGAEVKEHNTTPPARYTEASLTKRLEELGVGRPSTYATIMSTIIDRGYVAKNGNALVPNWIAFSVIRLLENHFAELVDYDFTATMEADLDDIAAGTKNRENWLREFYFGSATHPGLRRVVDNLGEVDARAINTVQISKNIALRNGRYGPYLEVLDEKCERDDNTGKRKPRAVSIPADLAPDELTEQKATELAAAEPASDRVLGVNPASGRNVIAKTGRFGAYVAEQLADGEELPKGEKLPIASLFKTMDSETVDLETAIKLLSLPREVGVDTEHGDEMIYAQNGRYGPYIKRGIETRSLSSEAEIFSIDVKDAQALFASPKYGKRKVTEPLRVFDVDPVTGRPIVVRDGRFGPYITDGSTNVTVPRGEGIPELTYEQVVDLLAAKRAKGSAKKWGTKAPARKAAVKKEVDQVRSAAAKKAAETRKANREARLAVERGE